MPKSFPSITEQVATHLAEELRRGRWKDTMPGRNQLVKELGVSGMTVDLALELLEKEGLLVGQGKGRPRRIERPDDLAPQTLQIGILVYEDIDRNRDYMVELQHLLAEDGHVASFAPKTMVDLNMDIKRIGRMVEDSAATAWLAVSAPRQVLEWFSERSIPAFALFGRRSQVRIAGTGPDHAPPMRAATRRLIELGHRRIVILRRWEPGANSTPPKHTSLDEMEKHGISTSRYNVPIWEPTPEGLCQVLDELFRITPPTALIIDEAFLFHAAREYLAQIGFLSPRDVSLICVDADPTLEWCRPSVAHLRWSARPFVRRILRWANNVSHGKEDLRQSSTKAEFVDGGTIGPAPKRQ